MKTQAQKRYEKPRITTMTSAQVLEAMGPVQGYGQGVSTSGLNSGSKPSSLGGGSGPFAIAPK